MSAPSIAAPMTIRTNADPSRALWGMVLIRGLADAVTPNPIKDSHRSGSRVCVRDQDDARDWLASRDFNHICALAGIEPDAVLDWYDRVIDGGEGARAVALKTLTGGEGDCRRGNGRQHRQVAA